MNLTSFYSAITGSSHARLADIHADVVKNEDGTVDIYFGPTAPEGHESNWLPTDPDRRFFLLARFYGPEPSLLDSSFELNDMERMD